MHILWRPIPEEDTLHGDVSIDWVTNRNWQTKVLRTWEVTLNLPRQERVKDRHNSKDNEMWKTGKNEGSTAYLKIHLLFVYAVLCFCLHRSKLCSNDFQHIGVSLKITLTEFGSLQTKANSSKNEQAIILRQTFLF